MQLAIDLTPRQAARVIEQAVRARIEVEVEARNRADDEPLRGRLTGREGELLAIELAEIEPAATATLIGVFCEVRLVLLGEQYTFTTFVLDTPENAAPPVILVANPEMVQVTNRRRVERTNATIASQVRIWTARSQAPTVGLLANVSADGLGCNLPGTALDSELALGDPLRVSFELAGFDEVFELPAELCNKNLLPQRQQLFLGMKFTVRPDDPVACHTLERVRAALVELTTNFFDTDGEL